MSRQRLSPGRFAGLVAGLREELHEGRPVRRGGDGRAPGLLAHTIEPRSYAGRYWVWDLLDLDGAAAVTRLSIKSLHDYEGQARRARAAGKATHRMMPPPSRPGRWMTGHLALWRAVGKPGRQEAITRWDDSEILAFLADLLEVHGRAVSVSDARMALRRAGIPCGPDRTGWLLVRARKALDPDPEEITDGKEYGPLESSRSDGLVSTQQLAAAFGCSPAAISGARERGILTGYWDRNRWWYDPARVRPRKDARPGPVDAGHPLALPGQ